MAIPTAPFIVSRTTSSKSYRGLCDWIGISVASLCVVHCLAIGLVAVFPLLAFASLQSEWLHGLLFILSIPLSVLAFGRGWQFHRHLAPAGWGILGTCLIGLALTMPRSGPVDPEVLVTLAGVALLLLAHGLNLWGIKAHTHRPGFTTGLNT